MPTCMLPQDVGCAIMCRRWPLASPRIWLGGVSFGGVPCMPIAGTAVCCSAAVLGNALGRWPLGRWCPLLDLGPASGRPLRGSAGADPQAADALRRIRCAAAHAARPKALSRRPPAQTAARRRRGDLRLRAPQHPSTRAAPKHRRHAHLPCSAHGGMTSACGRGSSRPFLEVPASHLAARAGSGHAQSTSLPSLERGRRLSASFGSEP